MLELNAAPTATGDLIKNTTEATFMADVVETSKETPVIVDFWAPWCGPCKTLGPALEAAVQAAGGKVKMVKIDVDQNQQIATQMQIQSIPAVFAFVDGQPVDGFMGAKSPSELTEFVTKIADMNSDDGGLEDALDAAEQMLDEGEADDAAQTFAAILEEDANSARAYAGLARSYLTLGELDKALAVLETVPEALASDPLIGAVRAQAELAGETADTGEVGALLTASDGEPDNHQARFDLAMAQFGEGDAQAAIDSLLEVFRRDREWNEDAARQQLFKIFDSLGPKDLIAQKGRRKLSSMIFL